MVHVQLETGGTADVFLVDEDSSSIGGKQQQYALKKVGMYQCFFFNRNVGQVTPKIMHLHFLKKNPDQSIQKTFNF